MGTAQRGHSASIRRAALIALLSLLIGATPALATSSTVVVRREIRAGSGGSEAMNVSESTIMNGALFFSATDGTHGYELWTSDGTESGTYLFKDINPGAASSNPSRLEVVGGYLYFTANDGVHGLELWKSDGTVSGTTMVKDITTGSDSSSISDFDVSWLAIGSTLFFTNNDATGSELWKTDGTAAGTMMVKDINETPFTGSNPTHAVVMGGYLYFNADDGVNGTELWRSDGTTAGTTLVADIFDGGSSEPQSLAVVGSTLYFTAFNTCGRELWKSDGTGVGTTRVKDINPAGECGEGASSNPSYLTPFGSSIIFRADDGEHGSELWKSDGTEGGTLLVKDLNADGSSSIDDIVVLDGVAYFSANGGMAGGGYELWKSDGTEGGTTVVNDLNPGLNGSYPFNLYPYEGDLWYFAEPDGEGLYLYQYDPAEDAVQQIPLPEVDDEVSCECQRTSILGGDRRIFFPLYGSATGGELGVLFLDGLPSTDREPSGWTTALALAAALTAAAGVGLRLSRGTMRR